MKKLLLLLTLALLYCNVSAQADDNTSATYDPLVSEGKIWWYGQSDLKDEPLTPDYQGMTIEYGLTFDGEDIITEQMFIDDGRIPGAIRDEGPWQKLVVIRKADYNTATNKAYIYDNTPFAAHYLKEDDKIVKAIDAVPNTRLFDKNDMHAVGISILYYNWNTVESGAMLPILYNFEDNEDDLLMGDEGLFVRLQFKCKERKDFFGTERLVKTFVKLKNDDEVFPKDPLFMLGEGAEIDITEGIGLTEIRNTVKYIREANELFFSPFTYVPSYMQCSDGKVDWFRGGRQPMLLRYVTDMDYNIIYEGIGGVKAWELEPSGVEDVCLDGSESALWYTIGGVKIAEPTAAGIYLRRIGNRTDKVVIR